VDKQDHRETPVHRDHRDLRADLVLKGLQEIEETLVRWEPKDNLERKANQVRLANRVSLDLLDNKVQLGQQGPLDNLGQ
jgi:hypothetical protein